MRPLPKSTPSGLLFMLVTLAGVFACAQKPDPAITLDPPTGWELQAHNFDSKGNALRPAPANFRRFGEATAGQPSSLHTLMLSFGETTTLTEITATSDFQIEQGGSCVKGNVYQRGATCSLLVRFTPQGPGRRLGQLTVARSGSSAPISFGLGGVGYAPTLSFIPSQIQTVAGTYPAKVGLLNGAQNLAVDGGDRLYIADTSNQVVRMIDSSGTISAIWNASAPIQGIAVDSNGEAWFTEPLGAAPALGELFVIPYAGAAYVENGTNFSANCLITDAPCLLSNTQIYSPGSLSIAPDDTLFFADATYGAAMITEPVPWHIVQLHNFSTFNIASLRAFAVDANDNLYSADLSTAGTCRIVSHSLNDAEHLSPGVYHQVAGGYPCGFSGDGGRAANAEISYSIGQIAFDIAGNMYFTDSHNHRVRRVDAVTGIIRTIAGNGVAGYAGDGGPATSAQLHSPTGVAVDSQGQVYIISNSAPSGALQVVRKVTSQGLLSFGKQVEATSSTVHLAKVSNTGNSVMLLTHFAVTGTNAADFVLDPVTTSCNLSAGATLDPGATCTIGVIFTPPTVGARSAKLVFADNTVTNSNTILLNGTGTLPAAAFQFITPVSGHSSKSGTPVTLTAGVTSTKGAAPTGTVGFFVDGVAHGSPVSLSSGTASVSVSGLSTANHTFSASYSGDSNYSKAGPITVSIVVTAIKAPVLVSHAPKVE